MPTITHSSSQELLKNYHDFFLPPLANETDDKFVVAQLKQGNVLRNDLLAVSNQNDIIHLFPEEKTAAGWQSNHFSVDEAPNTDIGKLLAYYGAASTLFVFADYPQNDGTSVVLGMRNTPDRGWEPVVLSPNLKNAFGKIKQGDLFRDLKGNTYYYGVSTNFNPAAFVLAGFDSTANQMKVLFQEIVSNPQVSYFLIAGNSNQDIGVATVDGNKISIRSGSVVNGAFKFDSNPAVVHDFGNNHLSIKRVFTLASPDSFLLLTTDNKLYYISAVYSANAKIQLLTGGAQQPAGIQNVSTGVDSQNRQIIFGIESGKRNLWILRQNLPQGSTANTATDITFDPWSPLGNTLQTIACPARMPNGPQVFYYDLNKDVKLLQQNLDDTLWYPSTLLVPQKAAQQLKTYHTFCQEIRITDNNNVIQRNQVVTVTPSRDSLLVVNELGYTAGPKSPITVKTDSRGLLTAYVRGNSLDSPTISVTKDNTHFTTSRLDYGVFHRLSGTDKSFSVSGQTLKDAKILPNSFANDQADLLANKIKAISTAALHHYGPSQITAERKRSLQQSASFIIRISQGSKLEIEDIDANAFKQLSNSESLHLLGGTFGDIVHFFQHALKEIKSIVVNVENGVVNLIINGEKFVLDTVEKIGKGLLIVLGHVLASLSFLDGIGELLGKLLKWLLKDLGLSDIFLTQKLVKFSLNQLFSYASTELSSDLPTKVQKTFNTYKEKLTDLITNVEKHIDPQLNLNAGYSKKPSSLPDVSELKKLEHILGVQSNFFISKLESIVNVQNINIFKLDGIGSPPFTISQLISNFQKVIPTEELEQSLKTVQDAFSQKVHNFDDFLKVDLVLLLEALKDVMLLVLSAIEFLILEILQGMAYANTALQKIINQNVDIPFFSAFYKGLTNEDLSVINLLSFLIAVPATIFHKFIYHEPIVDEATLQKIMKNGFNFPSISQILGDGTNIRENAESLSSMQLLQTDAKVVKALAGLSLTAGISLFALDDISDAIAYFGGETSLPFTIVIQVLYMVSAIATASLVVADLALILKNQGSAVPPSAITFVVISVLLVLVPIFTNAFFSIAGATGTLNPISRFGGSDYLSILITILGIIFFIISIAAVIYFLVESKSLSDELKTDTSLLVLSAPWAYMWSFLAVIAGKAKMPETTIIFFLIKVLMNIVSDMLPSVLLVAAANEE